MSLPNQPSELLKLALNDLEQVENDPRYDINMGEWHYPRSTGCSARSISALRSSAVSRAATAAATIPGTFWVPDRWPRS